MNKVQQKQNSNSNRNPLVTKRRKYKKRVQQGGGKLN